VEALCAPECAGRAAGSPEGARARAFLIDELAAIGVKPAIEAVEGCGGANLIVTFGDGPRTVLAGAHYDHLGGEYLGADDNAAACAALLEVCAGLAARPPAGRVLIVFFDGEEPPHFLTPAMGSIAWTTAHAAELPSIDLMIALDLVGHAVGPVEVPPAVRDTLFVLGAEKSAGLAAIASPPEPGVVPRCLGIDLVPPLSDYQAFREAGVPFLFATCGRWQHYHTPEDVPARLAYGKLAGVARWVERVVRDVAAGPPRAGRFDASARDHATTIRSLLELVRALDDPRADLAVPILEGLQKRVGPLGELAAGDWSTLVQLVGMLEQGLA
jgi:hypothetical protein